MGASGVREIGCQKITGARDRFANILATNLAWSRAVGASRRTVGTVAERYADAVGDERAAVEHGLAGVADAVGALDGLEGALEARRLVGREREQRLARAHGVARLRVQVDARRVLHRVLLARASGAETPGADAERQRLLLDEHAVAVRDDRVRLLRDRQRRIRVAALGADDLAPLVHRAAVLQRGLDVHVGLAGQREHLPRQRDRQFDDVGGSAAGEHLDRFAHLVGVADREAERDVHVGEERRGGDTGILARARPSCGRARATARCP